MTTAEQQPVTSGSPDEMREFMIVVRQALMLICSWIERRYGLQRKY